MQILKRRLSFDIFIHFQQTSLQINSYRTLYPLYSMLITTTKKIIQRHRSLKKSKKNRKYSVDFIKKVLIRNLVTQLSYLDCFFLLRFQLKSKIFSYAKASK